jgi:hypothetical protein
MCRLQYRREEARPRDASILNGTLVGIAVRDAQATRQEVMSDWNADIVKEFRANAGKVGGQLEDASRILTHHLGAKLGIERVTPVGCFPQPDGRLAIVASNGARRRTPTGITT